MFNFIKSLILRESKKTPDGTYVAVKLSEESKDKLYSAAEKMKVPNILDKKDYHTTLIYSRKYLPEFEAKGELNPPIAATISKLEIFTGKDGDQKVLVAVVDCPELVERHKSIMDEHKATYDFDEYVPHVTLSYNCNDFDVKSHDILENIESPFIEFVEEYSTDLDLDWAKDKE